MRDKILVCSRRLGAPDRLWPELPYVAGRVYSWFQQRYGAGRIFRDVAGLRDTANPSDYPAGGLEEWGVFLLVVDPGWHRGTNGSRGFDDPNDRARIEIEWALQQKVPILPLFVGGAKFPPANSLPESLREVHLRNGVELRPDPGFLPDIEDLGRKIDGLLSALNDPDVELDPYGIPIYPRPGLGRLASLLRRQSGSATQRVNLAVHFLEEKGDPRFCQDWYLSSEPLLGFVKIADGAFTMGSDPDTDWLSLENERPAHEVHLASFYMARYPVTVAQYNAFVKADGFVPGDATCLDGGPSCPVAHVSWHEALAYCEWLTRTLREWRKLPSELAAVLRPRRTEAWRVTLPSEAEWEKAARGTDRRAYPWEGEIDLGRANYAGAAIGGTSPVGCFPNGRSPYGIEDLCGNVWEWTRSVSDKYDYNPYDGRENLTAPGHRALRGGSFKGYGRPMRSIDRRKASPDERAPDIGFRVVLSPFFPRR